MSTTRTSSSDTADTITALIAALTAAKDWTQLPEEAYHLVVVPEEAGIAACEHFETVDALLERLHALLGTPVQVFCFTGIAMPIVRKTTATGTVRYLQTPEGRRVIAKAIVEEEEVIEEGGTLADPIPDVEDANGPGIPPLPEESDEEAEPTEDDDTDGFPEDDEEDEDEDEEGSAATPPPAPVRARRR